MNVTFLNPDEKVPDVERNNGVLSLASLAAALTAESTAVEILEVQKKAAEFLQGGSQTAATHGGADTPDSTIIVIAQLPRCESIADLVRAVERGDGESSPLIFLGDSTDPSKKAEVLGLMKSKWDAKFEATHNELKKIYAKYSFVRLAVKSSFDFGGSIAGPDYIKGKIRNQNDFYALASGLFDTTGKAKARDKVQGIDVPEDIIAAKKISWHAAAQLLLTKLGPFEG